MEYQCRLLKDSSFYPLYAAGEERVVERSKDRVSQPDNALAVSTLALTSLVNLLTRSALRRITLSFASKKEGLKTFSQPFLSIAS
jgi:hypothetical protein